MASAAPGERRIATMAKGGKPGSGGSGGGTTPTGTVTNIAPLGSPAPNKTVGKVFFTSGRSNYVCSAAAVASANRRLVLTAGHCVHDGKGGGYVTNFLFVPGYDGTKAATDPYGRYAAASLHTTSAWAGSSDLAGDVGFATLTTVPSSTVGAFGLTFGRGVGLTTTAYGYPAAAPFDGRTLRSCGPGTTIRDPYGQNTQGLACNMTGGSSGGPWLTVQSGTTYAHSVNSYGYTSGPYRGTHMFGPYLGAGAKALYDSVQG